MCVELVKPPVLESVCLKVLNSGHSRVKADVRVKKTKENNSNLLLLTTRARTCLLFHSHSQCSSESSEANSIALITWNLLFPFQTHLASVQTGLHSFVRRQEIMYLTGSISQEIQEVSDKDTGNVQQEIQEVSDKDTGNV